MDCLSKQVRSLAQRPAIARFQPFGIEPVAQVQLQPGLDPQTVRLIHPVVAFDADGRTALANGTSKWITSEKSRGDVQRLRARACAVITGSGTVVADDPMLTARDSRYEMRGRRPIRIVLDTDLLGPIGIQQLDGGLVQTAYALLSDLVTLARSLGRADASA